MKPRARVRPATCDTILHGGVMLPLGIIAQHVTPTQLVFNAASIADIFCSEKKAMNPAIDAVISDTSLSFTTLGSTFLSF